MYNEREKLFHHQQLLSPKEAAADLALLRKLNPNHPRLQEFEFSPSRSAGDILLVLLGLVHRDDIVKNRLQHKQAPKPEPAPEPEPTPELEPAPEPEPAPGEEEDSEKQELKDQLEEKEEEVADLQDQLEEKEDQIADLEDQLAEEKKSETPVKAPAKKTTAKKTTAKKTTAKKSASKKK